MNRRYMPPSMDYTVSGSDTLERIAASHDCTVGELMKLNKMTSRMVFAGQKMHVPLPVSDDVFEGVGDPPASSTPRLLSNASETSADGIRRGPGRAVPTQSQRRGSLTKTRSAPVGSNEEGDADCLQRFLKIKVKQVTESDGTVSGTLLVTPNCLMFDPDVSHPLVKENGQDLYGMVANMDEIIAVSVYKEIGGLVGDRKEKKKEIFDPNHIRTPQPHDKSLDNQRDISNEGDASEKVIFSNDQYELEYDNVDAEEQQTESHSPKPGSETFLPAISEETNRLESPEDNERRRAVSDVTAEHETLARGRSRSPASEERPRSFSELDAGQQQSGFGSRFSPNAARRSFGKLGRTLSARAKSIQGTVAQGTKQVAHGVVTHTKSAADSLQTGLETSVKVMGEAANAAANQAKAAADVVATVPGKMVDMGSSIGSEVINGVNEIFNVELEDQLQRSPTQLKREQSLATLEGLKHKTQQARDDSARNRSSLFLCATSSEEMPDLFLPVDEIISRNHESTEEVESPQLPYYMAVRLTRKKRITRRSSPSGSASVSSYDEDFAFGNKLKREFWFAIPRSKADNIYHFLLQWSPEKYGQDTTLNTLDDSSAVLAPSDNLRDDRGFIILDSSVDESLTGEKPAPLFGSSHLNREWELVTVREMCRRLSLDDSVELPVPKGAETSQILDELMIRQLMDILPPRAEGYPWVNIYNSEKHGFSLSTLYRKMAEFDEDLSPVLLIIRDTKEHVFGAIVSGAIRPNDHYWGTGDSCSLWRFTGEAPHTRELRQYMWTGDNQFFVNAAKDSLSIGAGGGHFGLWMDSDMNLGRSQRCDTFDNEPLSGDKEDFVIQFVEAFGFRE